MWDYVKWTEYTTDELDQYACDFGEYYYYGDSTCYVCHPSCIYGCLDDDPCDSYGTTYTQYVDKKYWACAWTVDRDTEEYDTCRACIGHAVIDGDTVAWDMYQDNGKSDGTSQKGVCVCPDGFTGEPDNCQPICAVGCKICTGVNKRECTVCEEGYQMQKDWAGSMHWEYGYDGGYNQSFYFNECQPCPNGQCTNVNAAFTFGEGYMGQQCDSDSQFFNNDMNECQECNSYEEGILACEGFECTDCGDKTFDLWQYECEEGYFFDEEGVSWCTQNCATSFYLPEGNSYCVYPEDAVPAADIVFNLVPCDNKVWTYEPEVNSVLAPVSVKFVAGIHEDWDSSDPYLIDDRGLWFDGKYDFIVIHGLKVHTKFAMSQWAKPHGSGTLFSVSRLHDYEKEQYWAVSVKGRKL